MKNIKVIELRQGYNSKPLLDERINNFIEKHDIVVLDIKYAIVAGTQYADPDIKSSALLIYKETGDNDTD